MKPTLATLLFICTVPFLLAQGSTSTQTEPAEQPSQSAQDDRGAQLMFSTSPDRENAQPLDDAALAGEVYIFFDPQLLGEVDEVAFYLNDSQTLSPLQVELVAPFDFAGSDGQDAYPFNVDDLSRRDNTITVEAVLASGERVSRSAAFVAEGVSETLKADYVVALDGSDENSGSVDAPFGTIAKALSVAQAGERIQLRGGVYKEYINGTSFEVASGTQLAPIIIESYPGEEAIIDGSEEHWSSTESTGYPALFRLEEIEWYIVQNLTFRNSAGRALHLEGNHNVVRNVHSYDHHSDGVYITGDYNLLEGIVSHGNNSEQNGGDSADGIKLAFGDSNVIRNCRLYGNSDDGIDTWQTTNTLVEFCIAHGNGSGPTGNGVGFKLGPGKRGGQLTARYNISYKNRNNNFDTNGAGNVTLVHNTSWQAGHNGFMFNTRTDKPNIAVNNISYEDHDLDYGKDDEHSNNTWNLDIENPEFISLNPDSPDFLRLEEDSPAINAGARVDLPYAGPAPDLGALEHGQEVAEFNFENN